MTLPDIVIVGGGLSGLTLALHLCEKKFSHLKILVLERRSAYARDRTWSYWAHESDRPHIYQSSERKVWHEWSLALGDHTTRCSAPGWSYRSLDADAVYRQATHAIAQCPWVDLKLGVRVSSDLSSLTRQPVLDNKLVNWVDADGNKNQARARWTLDARGRIPGYRNEVLTGFSQHFVGREVEADTPVFNENCVELMHFQTDARGLHFQYLLPYDSHRALIEDTWISRADLAVDYAQAIEETLQRRWPTARFETLFEERGHLALQSPTDLGLRLGAAAGLLRPSTGYAFCATLAHCAQVADWFALRPESSLSFPQAAQAGVDAWMDKVLFDAMEQDWRRAPAYFLRMFERCEPDALLQFLRGPASWAQRLRVMRALPTLPFARAAVGSGLRRVMPGHAGG